jgi:hypothetical protein
MSEMSGQEGLVMEIVLPAAALRDLIEKPKFVKFNCKEVAADKALDQAIEFVMNATGNWTTRTYCAARNALGMERAKKNGCHLYQLTCPEGV